MQLPTWSASVTLDTQCPQVIPSTFKSNSIRPAAVTSVRGCSEADDQRCWLLGCVSMFFIHYYGRTPSAMVSAASTGAAWANVWQCCDHLDRVLLSLHPDWQGTCASLKLLIVVLEGTLGWRVGNRTLMLNDRPGKR